MRATEWITGFAGAIICIVGAVVFAKSQMDAFPLWQSPLQALWPMPGLTLLDWATLGFLGFASVALGHIRWAFMWSKVTWMICGALIPLMLLGTFSIGPVVMWAVLCFGLAAALAWDRQKPYVVADFLAFALGALGNMALLLVFILVGRT